MEADVYIQIKRSVKSLLDINLDYYKDVQMQRRLDSWLVRSGTPSWPDYFKRLRDDSQELARLRNYLTINVSAFFRDPERWQDLGQRVLPALLRAGAPLRAWSAGCSIGLEPYSLAMVLDEATSGRRHYLLATDLDRGALVRAQARGPFTADDIQNVNAARRAAYFDPGGPPYFVRESLAKRIVFREQDLLTDEFEVNFDLIMCRNVLIYFTAAAKDALYRKFHAALRPGGVLFAGGTEFISNWQGIGFNSYGIGFYQKS